MYNKVPTDLNFVSREREVARLWKEKDVIHKSFDLRKDGEHFTFFDGPPTANGKPHIGHMRNPRHQRPVPPLLDHEGLRTSPARPAGIPTACPWSWKWKRSWAWTASRRSSNTASSPSSSECKESVWKYKHEWEKMSDRVGYWADMEHPYVTYDNDYIEIANGGALKTDLRQGPALQGAQDRALLPPLRHRPVQPRGGPGL